MIDDLIKSFNTKQSDPLSPPLSRQASTVIFHIEIWTGIRNNTLFLHLASLHSTPLCRETFTTTTTSLHTTPALPRAGSPSRQSSSAPIVISAQLWKRNLKHYFLNAIVSSLALGWQRLKGTVPASRHVWEQKEKSGLESGRCILLCAMRVSIPRHISCCWELGL
jgi:hypothetical protein